MCNAATANSAAISNAANTIHARRRRLKNGDVVRSYEQFCEYLEVREDGVARDELGFHGRNVCLYYRGREARSLKGELGESSDS